MTAEPSTSVAPTSEIRKHGDHATLVFRRYLRHPPERVWAAITDPAQLRGWLLTEARIDGRVGGHVELVTTNYRVVATGRVLSWDPPKLFEHEWNVAPGGALPNDERSVVRWELSPHDAGTLLTLTQANLTEPTARGYQVGLEAFLDRLNAQLAAEPLPDWEGRIRELRGGRSAWA